VIDIGIVGGTGYTAAELLRLLTLHPAVRVRVVTARAEAGTAVADLFPQLRGRIDLRFSPPIPELLAECRLVFFATPNGTAMTWVPTLLEAGVRVVDLSADFRLRDPATFERCYGMTHACPALLEEAVYGLPELNREAVRGARLIANPGCYPTAVALGLIPLLACGAVREDSLIADCKSGVSGAGRKARIGALLAEAADSLKAYGVAGHRHLPEIVQTLRGLGAGQAELCFVPHLAPMIRGIHATLYAELSDEAPELQGLYAEHYRGEPFVDLMPPGAHPETRSVRGANVCRLAVHRVGGGRRAVVLSVIDNLVKGAAGQAIQNMNLMLGLDETLGLTQVALSP
jgi:N-acetyl-gamma-glutamyl-phosphate reductase